jgi:phage-related protein
MSDLSLTPDYVFDESPEYKTVISEFESGVEQRRAKQSTPVRRWTLRFITRTQADYNTITSLFATCYGALTAFTWTNPNDSTEYTVRFDSDKITFQRIAYQRYNFEFTLKEVK